MNYFLDYNPILPEKKSAKDNVLDLIASEALYNFISPTSNTDTKDGKTPSSSENKIENRNSKESRIPKVSESTYVTKSDEELAEILAKRGYDISMSKRVEVDPSTVVKKQDNVVAVAQQTFPTMHPTDRPKANLNFSQPARIVLREGVSLSPELEAINKWALDNGISYIVTKGFSNKKTAQGKKSFHSVGQAMDIIPHTNETWDSLKASLIQAKFNEYLKSQGYGILDETNPEIMKRTGATGPHLHIGRDKIAAGRLGMMLNPYK